MFREFEERARKARQAHTAQLTPPTSPTGGRNPLRPAPAPAKQSSIRRIHSLMATMWGSVSIGTQLGSVLGAFGVFSKTNLVNYEQRVSSYIENIIFENSLFVSGGNNGIYTSADGITWTQRDVNAFRSIIFENSLFVAVGNSGIHTSADGITWTAYPQSEYIQTLLTVQRSELNI